MGRSHQTLLRRGAGVERVTRHPSRSVTTGLLPAQVNHLRCLHEFVESQTTYYAQCYRHMLDLQKQLGRCPLGSLGSQAH